MRFASTVTSPTGEFYDSGIAPYGESYDSSAPLGTVGVFAGAIQDTIAGMFDTPGREYDTPSGRWLSPDPAGLAAVDLTNPQSLNRYAYVGNNPTSATDPTGLFRIDPSDPCNDPFYEGGSCAGGIGDPFPSQGTGGGGVIFLPEPVPEPGGGGDGGGGRGSIGGSPGGTSGGHFPTNTGPLSGDFGPTFPLSPWQLWGPGSGLPCEFGPCNGFPTGDNGFVSAEAVAVLAGEGLEDIVCPECALVVFGAEAAYAGYKIYQARKRDIKQFDDAVREIGRRCGRPLTPDEQRQLHDSIHGFGLDYNGIVQEGVNMFCPGH